MKILKIRFENIHSLKGKHEVDFGDGILGEAGLFAITGPTGSGKSTLLDVITLALYDNIARMGKMSTTTVEDDGGIMTRNMKSCYAEVEYRVNGKNYRSHWSIERNRNNNLNSRKLELVESETGHILSSGVSDTPKMNSKIIGLSYEQFVKAMVLSQGEFSKLLQAPRNERNKLLEDITGARSYREIGKAVFIKYKGFEKSVALKNANLEGIVLLTEEAIAEKKKELKSLFESKPLIEKAFQKASDKIIIRKELQSKEKERIELENEKVKLRADLNVFNPYKAQLENHDRLSKYAVKLIEYDTTVKDFNSLTEQFKKLQTSKSESETQQKTYLKTISNLIKEEVDIETANQKLDGFRSKIVDYQAEEKKKQDEGLLYQNQLNTYVRNINQLGYELTKAEKPEVFRTLFDLLRKSVQDSINNSGMKSMQELNASLELHRNKHEKAGEFLTKKDQALKLQKNLESLNAKLKIAKETSALDLRKIDLLEKEIPKLTKEVEVLEKTLEHQRKHQSLELHRQQLTPEEPCPLCGSLEHPYALEEPYFDIKEELLKEKKESLKTKSDLAISLKTKNKFQEKEILELQSEIKATTDDKIQNQDFLIELSNLINWNHEESLESLQNRRKELTETIHTMETCKQAFQAHSTLKDLEESLMHWEIALKTYDSLKQQRMALYEGNDINQISNTFTSNITQSITHISSLKKQLRDIEEKLNSTSLNKNKREDELSNIVFKEQLENIAALRALILSDDKASRIRAQGNKLHEQKTRISEKENLLDKALKELREKDNPEIPSEELTLLFDDSKRKWEEISRNIGKITQSLEEDEKSKARQQTALNELNLLKKDLALWKSMNDLIGDATGNKFSNFVQDLTLEQLIGFANNRLSEFSDRYLLDIPTANEAEKSDTLKIFDKYMGNARRSVRTLSGGETFLVSLAMAFALSDIAARNVKIESLFIDEGFGTLDPETLDQAITILEKMQNEGDKSVGVISHVSALKERITTQIKLDKGSLGYSTLEVVQ